MDSRGKGRMEVEGDTSKETSSKEEIIIDQPPDDQEMPSWVIDLQGEQRLGRMLRKSKMAVAVRSQGDLWNYVEPADTEPHFQEIYGPYKVSLGSWVAFEPDQAPLTSQIEEMKKRNLVYFLRNSTTSVDHFYEGLRNDVKQLCDTYSGLALRWSKDDDSFLHKMLLDGCFILEFLRTTRLRSEEFSLDNPIMSPIVQNDEDLEKYMHDVLLLRNQLPMKLLLTLIRLHAAEDFLWEDIRGAFSLQVSIFYDGLSPNDDSAIYTMRQSLHLLDFHRRMLLRYDFNRGRTPRGRKKLSDLTSIISSATEMEKLGLKFTTTDTEHFLPRRLRTTICLPQISLDDSTRSLFFNMINFEKNNPTVVDCGLCQEIYFMGCLVKSPEDAKLLMSEEVIVGLSSPNEVFQLLKRMIEHIPLQPNDLIDSYNIESVSIVVHHTKIRQRWIKDLFDTYLKTPWTVLSIIAGLFLFAFGFLQTLYTMRGYYYQIRHP